MLGILVPFGLTRIPGTGTLAELSGTQKADSERIFKPSRSTAVIIGANFLSFNFSGVNQFSLFGENIQPSGMSLQEEKAR